MIRLVCEHNLRVRNKFDFWSTRNFILILHLRLLTQIITKKELRM